MEEGARDLLLRFSGGFSVDEISGGDSDEIELDLSIGGCFNSKNSVISRAIRSSTISTLLPSEFRPVVPLVRACSMPNETEEIRHRREMQSIKRMVAKRKREEKRNSKRFEEDFDGRLNRKRRFEVERNGVIPSLRSLLSASQCSVVSQGSTSSGGSEFESRLGQGFEVLGLKNGSDIETAEFNSHKTSSISSSSTIHTQTSKSISGSDLGNGIGDVGTGMMEEMPSVSTKGSGPNGRRIEGFLYRYGKGEELSIVCVCHGSFLTPAEFVKHAGGGEVDHPLRHIIVNPVPGIFL